MTSSYKSRTEATDDRACAIDQQRPQLPIFSPRYRSQPFFAAARLRTSLVCNTLPKMEVALTATLILTLFEEAQ